MELKFQSFAENREEIWNSACFRKILELYLMRFFLETNKAGKRDFKERRILATESGQIA